MTAATEAVEVVGVSKVFGGVRAVDDLTTSFPSRAITGLIGPNGAGKTCLLDIISGASRPTRGRVMLDGQDVTRWSAARRSDRGLARVFQGVRAFGSLTVSENLRLAARHRRRDLQAEPLERAEQLLANVLKSGAAVASKEPVDRLPYAIQKTLPIAMAVAASPRVLLLDEPTVGFPQETYQLVANEIRAIAASGVCVILVEHNLDVMRDLAERVLFMAQGALIRVGSFAELESDHDLRSKYFGA